MCKLEKSTNSRESKTEIDLWQRRKAGKNFDRLPKQYFLERQPKYFKTIGLCTESTYIIKEAFQKIIYLMTD
jgi:hypothetical protein